MAITNAPLEYPNPKRAGSSKPYRLRFDDYLSETPGDVLTGATITATPSDMTISDTGNTDMDVYWTASGGTPGKRYRLDIAFTSPSISDTVSVFLRVV